MMIELTGLFPAEAQSGLWIHQVTQTIVFRRGQALYRVKELIETSIYLF